MTFGFTLLAGIFIGLVLALIFGWIGAWAIAGPVTALLKGVKSIEEGHYGYKIDLERRGIIGDLISDFNRMSDKLSEVDKLKSDFMSVISHELYTPLTPIKEAAFQLKADPRLADSAKSLVGIIDRQTAKMQNLVDEVLDFSWLEIKEWKLNLDPVNPRILAQEIILENNEKTAKKKIRIKEKVGEKLPTVKLDKKRIKHVLNILLDNAIKFSPEGSEVVLTVDRVGGGVEFAVSDQGVGLKPHDIENIFKSFTQVEDHMTRTRGGMGLGLAIAKRIVEAHNGTIWAESPGLGEGSRFIFLLPMG
ncbi:MAG: HAMP domain-containing sensor histidine kinase [Candidatus Margulisiibacteriota bacterium]